MATVLVLGLIVPAAALAAKPDRFQWEPIQFDGVVYCDGFEDDYTDYYNVTETDFYDRSGDLVRAVLHVEHHSTDTNSVSGSTFHEHGHFTEVYDVASDTWTDTGSQEIANMPGKGIVIGDMGRLVYDVDFNILFFAGSRNHSGLLLGEQVYCDALG